ncbi:MAG: hypothetical protein LLG00_14370 [Planctomycetaceae bacterium]|nr:hypothetical protein [Planctomycetaceae bacterium]
MFDPSNDLAALADGTEPVTLLRRGCDSGSSGTLIPHALRRASTSSEASVVGRGDVHKNPATGGRCTTAGLVWHLPTAELPDSPSLGDVILDRRGERWTVMTVKRTTLGTRWRCESRNVSVTYGLDDTISVLKAVAGLGGTTWQTWKTGIRARIQLSDSNIVTDADTPYTTRHFRIFIEEELQLDHTCGIRGPDGTLYAITGTVGGDRIGELQVIEAEIRL